MPGRNDAKNPEQSKTPPTGKDEIERSGTEAEKHHQLRGLGRKIDREHEGKNRTGKQDDEKSTIPGGETRTRAATRVRFGGAERGTPPTRSSPTPGDQAKASKQARTLGRARRGGIWEGKGGDEAYQETARGRGSEEEPSSRGGVGGDGESGRSRELGREERRRLRWSGRWRGAGRVWAVLRPRVPNASI
jgi:hypothetical protein